MQEVAQIILHQLGGKMFAMMTGSKNFVGSEDSLSMKVGRNPKKITHVKVKLMPSDFYKMQFIKHNARTLESVVVNELEEVHCEELKDIFERYTGLFVSLSPRG